MSIIDSIVIGIIQGLTEFLPVSSSGHLVLSQHFLGITSSGDIAYEVFLHLGTVLAVLVFFRRIIRDLIVSLFNWQVGVADNNHYHNRLIIRYLVIATLTTAFMYKLFGTAIEDLFAYPMFVAVMLMFTGLIVFLSDLVKDSNIPAFSMGLWRSVLIGLAQSFAMVPGISRSGTTISVSLASGIKRRDSAHFSFLLSIPAIIGANLVHLPTIINLEKGLLLTYLAGFIAAFLSGYLVIAILITMIQSSKLKYFAFYCWLVAAISITQMLLS